MSIFNAAVATFETWWNTSPEGQKFRTEQAQAVALDRAGHADAIDSIEAERQRQLPALREAHAKATANLRAAEAALLAAHRAERVAYFDVYNLNVRADQKLDQHRAAMRDSAPPVIAAFISEMRDEWDRLRKEGLQTTSMMGNDGRGNWVSFGTSNGDAFRRRMAAVSDIISSSGPGLFWLHPDKLDAEIARLRETIPACLNVWDDPKMARRCGEVDQAARLKAQQDCPTAFRD